MYALKLDDYIITSVKILKHNLYEEKFRMANFIKCEADSVKILMHEYLVQNGNSHERFNEKKLCMGD
jgi:hypothetical protein